MAFLRSFFSLGVSLSVASFAEALYTATSPVKVLNAKQFQDTVVNSHDLHVVEFFAPWCGHCKSFAPEYEKVGKALRGIARVVAVEDESVMGTYGIKGFPTIKIFVGTGGKAPKIFDYQGARDGSSLLDFATTHIMKLAKARLSGKIDAGKDSPKSGGGAKSGGSGGSGGASDVIELTDSNFDKLVMADEKNVWFVEFFAPWCGHCKMLAPAWEGLATKLKGKVKIAKVDATKERALAARFGIQGFPSLKLFPAGAKSIALVKDYEGAREEKDMVAYASGFYSANIEVPQLLNDAQFLEECKEKKNLCIIAFLPHILDSQKKGRDAEIKTLNEIARGSIDLPLSFFWSQGGDQFDFEEQLHLAFGYPAVVAIHYEKGKYAVHRGDFSKDSCSIFITQLLSGKAPISALPKLDKLKRADKWDGKDAKPPVEDEL